MGNDSSQNYEFDRDQWQLMEKNPSHTLWKSRKDNLFQIQQHDILSRGQHEFQQERQIFRFRYKHSQLVAAYYFQEEQKQQFCSTTKRNYLFIEKIPITLVDIGHIPFPDCLHLYSQALLGFRCISQSYGCFGVQQKYVGVNERGVVKVWMNMDYSTSFIVGSRISEEQMVKGIVDIIDSNCDVLQLGSLPTVRNYLYRNADMINFQLALRELHNYVGTFNHGEMPNKLECIDRVGGIGIIINREYSQDAQTPRLLNQQEQHESVVYSRPVVISQERIDYPPPVQMLAQPVVQYKLKGSQVVPNARREQRIINPQFAKESMQIVRRRNSQHNTPVQSVPMVKQPMKYSQTINPQQHHSVVSPNKHATATITFNVSPRRPLAQSQQITPNTLPITRPLPPHNNRPLPPPNNRPLPPPQQNIYTQLAPASGGQITFKVLASSAKRTQNIQKTSIMSQDGEMGRVVNRESGRQFQRAREVKQVMIKNEGQQVIRAFPEQTSKIPQPVPNNNVPLSYLKEIAELKDESRQSSAVKQEFRRQVNQPTVKKEQSDFKPVLKQVPPGNQFFQTFNYKKSQQIKQTTFTDVPEKSVRQERTSYATVSADDGKSSQEFMRKLMEIKLGLGKSQQLQIKKQPSFESIQNKNGTQQKNYSTYERGNTYHYTNPEPYSNFHVDDQDFGRTAESNIIEVHEPFANRFQPKRNFEPLKFEKDLEMKYSMMQADEPEPAQYNAFNSYGSLDSDLASDLQKYKS